MRGANPPSVSVFDPLPRFRPIEFQLARLSAGGSFFLAFPAPPFSLTPLKVFLLLCAYLEAALPGKVARQYALVGLPRDCSLISADQTCCKFALPASSCSYTVAKLVHLCLNRAHVSPFLCRVRPVPVSVPPSFVLSPAGRYLLLLLSACP